MVTGQLLVSLEIRFFQVQSSAMSHTRMDNGPLWYLSQDTRAWVCRFPISECFLFAGKKKKKLNLYSCPDLNLTLSATWISFFQIWGILSPLHCALRMMMLNFFFAWGSSSPPQSTFFHTCQILIRTISCVTFISLWGAQPPIQIKWKWSRSVVSDALRPHGQ